MPTKPKAKLETVSLSGVEILAVGTWNGDAYDEEDLDAMVDAFSAGNAGIDPPVKLGHNADQKVLEQDGLPAAGYVSSLERKGKKLLASFRDVPKKIADLINAKAYSKISSEVYFNLKPSTGGKRLPRVLRAVALLGADIPAVTSIADIEALYGAPVDELREAFYTDPDVDADLHEYELASGVSYEVLSDRLRAALREAFPAGATDSWGPWLAETYGDHVIFSDSKGKYWSHDYTTDGEGKVTLSGTASEVIRSTTWTELAADEESEDEDLADELSAFLNKVSDRMKGKRGMPAMRHFMRETMSKLKALRPAKLKRDPEPEEETMAIDKKVLAKKLGLEEDADDDAIMAAVAKLQEDKPEPTGQYSQDDIRALQEKVGSLASQLAARDATTAVEDAIRSGKVLPAQKEWATGYASKDPEGFVAYIEKAPTFPLGARGREQQSDDGTELSESERSAAKLLGTSEEVLLKFKERHAANA